jgi:rubredoxin
MSNSNPGGPVESTAPSLETNPTPDAAANTALRDRHECSSCGYVYLPMKGDEGEGIPPNTVFDDLPEKWRCPVCSANKRRFQNLGPAGAAGFKENAKFGFGVNKMDPGRKNLLIFGSLFFFFLMFLSLYGLQ